MAENTFTGANLKFPNKGLHFAVAEVIKFRKQLTEREEFKSQSGWSDALNTYMVNELEKLADTLENITYNPDDKTQEQLEAEAADASRSLADDYTSGKPLTSDNLLMPVSRDIEVVWDLTGNDVDIPQVTPQNCPNDMGRSFITGLDNYFVQLTRLDSRFQTQTITPYESAICRALLNELYTITQRKGGSKNKSDIPSGTLNSQEAATFQG